MQINCSISGHQWHYMLLNASDSRRCKKGTQMMMKWGRSYTPKVLRVPLTVEESEKYLSRFSLASHHGDSGTSLNKENSSTIITKHKHSTVCKKDYMGMLTKVFQSSLCFIFQTILKSRNWGFYWADQKSFLNEARAFVLLRNCLSQSKSYTVSLNAGVHSK